MSNRLEFLWNRLGERLWVRPLLFCILSVAGAFLAKLADHASIGAHVPSITPESLDALLSIVASSMLVIATFAVASMVSAYASASGSATPRSFPLVIADDVSKNALSVFIGAFIFSIVSLVALKNHFFEKAGLFALFTLTLTVFAWVILTFVRWVDSIARLGRLGSTIDRVEDAAMTAFLSRRLRPNLGGVAEDDSEKQGESVFNQKIGYVQHVDTGSLQKCAEKHDLHLILAAFPGTFVTADRALLFCRFGNGVPEGFDFSELTSAFEVGDERVYEADPRFGLIALSEIAARALSPAVNDPGTAIGVLGSFVRIFSAFTKPLDETESVEAEAEDPFDRVAVPALSPEDMFDDAFTSIARDGAGSIEVQIRLQKTLKALSLMDDGCLASAARRHSKEALARAEASMTLDADKQRVRDAARW